MKQKKRKLTKKDVELLVPAGGVKQFIAAVENGADAVYVGGRAFNARINAANFDDETMQRAVDYAHERGVKLFVTMNILIKDEELFEALSYAKFLYEIGVDALIIQDIGFGSLLKKTLPDFELHLSTQATSCDRNSVEAMHKLGYERVVMARELSLAEICDVCNPRICDIEIFIHGALCICYSGQCQLSRCYGGRSGNRGMCAQPCRLPYKAAKVDQNTKEEFSVKTEPHPLSPRDLCQIDNIGKMIDAGVYSFKIEGRMKSPEYVAVVTRIYRKYIDKYIEEGSYIVSPEDRQQLLQIFNRGEFTEGYLYSDPGKRLMSEAIPKNQGVLVGEVSNVKKGSDLVDIKAYKDLTIGDGIEFHGDFEGGKPVGNILTYLKPLGDDIVRIGDFRGEIKKGDLVYRTSSKVQLDEARRSFEFIDLEKEEGSKYVRKLPIKMSLYQYGGCISIEARPVDKSIEGFSQVDAGPFEIAEENGTPASRYSQALEKTGNTPFEVAELDVNGDFDIKVKASELNALRRKCLEELKQSLHIRRQAGSFLLANEGEFVSYGTGAEVFFYELKDFESFAKDFEPKDFKILLPAAEILSLEASDLSSDFRSLLEENKANIILYISNVSKGAEDKILNDNYKNLLELAGENGIYAGNIGWITRLVAEGVKVYADYGLNIYNSYSDELLRELGCEATIGSLELADEQNGCYPLMVSEHSFDCDLYFSKTGHNLSVIKRVFSSQDVLVNEDARDDMKDAISELAKAGYGRVYFRD